MGEIRHAAQNFGSLPPVVARVMGDLIVWAVVAIGGEKEKLVRDGWQMDQRRAVVEQLNLAVRDVAVFAGLVKYKLGQRVFDVLAKAGERV